VVALSPLVIVHGGHHVWHMSAEFVKLKTSAYFVEIVVVVAGAARRIRTAGEAGSVRVSAQTAPLDYVP
jgi:hypothetical protein